MAESPAGSGQSFGATVDPNDSIELFGIVYIYNPAHKEKLNTGPPGGRQAADAGRSSVRASRQQKARRRRRGCAGENGAPPRKTKRPLQRPGSPSGRVAVPPIKHEWFIDQPETINTTASQ